jgi:hypothetical protein
MRLPRLALPPAALSLVLCTILCTFSCTLIACDDSGPSGTGSLDADPLRDGGQHPQDGSGSSDAVPPADSGTPPSDAAGPGDGTGPADPGTPPDGAAPTDVLPAADAPTIPPDLAGDVPADPDAPLPSPAVVFSEIMYHPVREDALIDRHEFLEIHNRAAVTVDVSGWRVLGDVQFTFPPGSILPATGYRVIAKDRAALMAIPSYALAAADIVGEYAGQLDNGGATITLVDAAGAIVDAVSFKDQFPWAIGADALGADEAWLPLASRPILSHQYRGRSLERYSFDQTGNDVANWTASPLDGATPARPNSVAGAPPAIVIEQWARGPAGSIIRSADAVTIHAAFSPGTLHDVRVEYFIDSLQRSDEAIVPLAMAAAAGGFEAHLPAAPDNSIVRYRVLGDRGAGVEVISPRPSDPYAWHGYFVTPVTGTAAPLYSIFIAKNDWTKLWDNIDFPDDQRRVDGCNLRASWNERASGVFVAGGQVFDVQLRYQGSRQHRPTSRVIDVSKTTIDPLPDRPDPLRALGWNIKFPSYANFEKRDTVVLNKLTQSCPGLDAAVAERLYGDARVNLPVSHVKYARVHVNGGYYHYMMDIEHPDSDLMKRYEPHAAVIGDLFKAGGVRAPNDAGGPDAIYDEGPYGWGDLRPLAANPSCPAIPLSERYAATYQRETYPWADYGALMKLVDDLAAARASLPNTAALRTFFAQNFDLAKLTDYIAIRNWSEPWDDNWQNYELYRRQDGRWLLMPWDDDQEFGEWAKGDATRSFFVGEEGDPDNNTPTGYSTGLWNRLKDGFIKSHRAELIARLHELDQTVLSPQNVKAKMDEAAAIFSQADANASPAGFACSFATEVAIIKSFADARHAAVGALP